MDYLYLYPFRGELWIISIYVYSASYREVMKDDFDMNEEEVNDDYDG